MIEIGEECIRLQTTSQIFANHVWTIIKKAWFPDFEILEIHQQKIGNQSNKT